MSLELVIAIISFVISLMLNFHQRSQVKVLKDFVGGVGATCTGYLILAEENQGIKVPLHTHAEGILKSLMTLSNSLTKKGGN
jgi:uncharacterized membrane protein (UPF0136 family)